MPIFLYIFAENLCLIYLFGIMSKCEMINSINLRIYCKSNCLVQLSGLSCPDSELICSECLFNPFAWCKVLPPAYLESALNWSRFEFITLQNYSPFKYNH